MKTKMIPSGQIGTMNIKVIVMIWISLVLAFQVALLNLHLLVKRSDLEHGVEKSMWQQLGRAAIAILFLQMVIIKR